MIKGSYLLSLAMAVGAIALSEKCSSTNPGDSRASQQTMIKVKDKTYLASNIYWDNGLYADIGNGRRVYGFEIVSPATSSMILGNTPVQEASNR